MCDIKSTNMVKEPGVIKHGQTCNRDAETTNLVKKELPRLSMLLGNIDLAVLEGDVVRFGRHIKGRRVASHLEKRRSKDTLSTQTQDTHTLEEEWSNDAPKTQTHAQATATQTQNHFGANESHAVNKDLCTSRTEIETLDEDDAMVVDQCHRSDLDQHTLSKSGMDVDHHELSKSGIDLHHHELSKNLSDIDQQHLDKNTWLRLLSRACGGQAHDGMHTGTHMHECVYVCMYDIVVRM
jgi:hypothetical protein